MRTILVNSFAHDWGWKSIVKNFAAGDRTAWSGDEERRGGIYLQDLLVHRCGTMVAKKLTAYDVQIPFALECAAGILKGPHFPTVYAVLEDGDYTWIIVEKLRNTAHRPWKAWNDDATGDQEEADKEGYNKIISAISDLKPAAWHRFPAVGEHKPTRSMRRAAEQVEAFAMRYAECGIPNWDMHEGNVMFRRNCPVINDPVFGELDETGEAAYFCSNPRKVANAR